MSFHPPFLARSASSTYIAAGRELQNEGLLRSSSVTDLARIYCYPASKRLFTEHETHHYQRDNTFHRVYKMHDWSNPDLYINGRNNFSTHAYRCRTSFAIPRYYGGPFNYSPYPSYGAYGNPYGLNAGWLQLHNDHYIRHHGFRPTAYRPPYRKY
ncbi:hypothetical protein AAVH_08456 [Aphelenchoides avenae]|nr:hypothetical protein AAVH_08456 [Aphelenchus avenae]